MNGTNNTSNVGSVQFVRPAIALAVTQYGSLISSRMAECSNVVVVDKERGTGI